MKASFLKDKSLVIYISSLFFVLTIIALDFHPLGFRYWLVYFGYKKDLREADHMIDQYNLYEQGYLTVLEPKFKDPKLRAKYGSNGLNWRYFRQENHNFYVKE